MITLRHFLVLWPSSLYSGLVSAALIELSWNITYVENVNPDGLHPRRAIGVNGVWPPPPISVTQDDTLLIHVHNGLSDVGTAIHSHGLFFNGSAFYDGAVSVTQWYISFEILHGAIRVKYRSKYFSLYCLIQPHSSRRIPHLSNSY